MTQRPDRQTDAPSTASADSTVASSEAGAEIEDAVSPERSVALPYNVAGKLMGYLENPQSSRLDGWMLATRERTTPVLMVDGLPAGRSEWPLTRSDVVEQYGVQRHTGFHFKFDGAPGAVAEIKAFDGETLINVTHLTLPTDGQPGIMSILHKLKEDAAKHDAVAVTCWDGAHNPIGRAKVLYDILDGRRPVWLFCYIFDEFGGSLWAPLANSSLRIVTIPWKERERYHRLLEAHNIKFPTVWMCKPRYPTLLLSSVVAAPDARLVLDFDDNEEHFSKSPGSLGKPYGRETIGLVRSLIEAIPARTGASVSISEDFNTEIVRHARKPTKTLTRRKLLPGGCPRQIGFVGTVRPHKCILDAAQAIRVANHIGGQPLEFSVYGDIRPEEYRKELEANSARIYGTVQAEDLEGILQNFDVILTGFPTRLAEDEAITRYQITSKIGDALANGKPVLVPRTRSVEDLEGTPGIYLFDRENFQEQLALALRYDKKIKLPEEFTLDGAYDSFRKAEQAADKDSSCLKSLTPVPTQKAAQSILLIWKQQDAGLYGRRVDQIARALKLIHPEITVRVIEFLNGTIKDALEKRASSFLSDASQILGLSKHKLSGTAVSDEGVIYNQILVASDDQSPNALQDFLWMHGHHPSNTLMIAFPAFALLTRLAPVLDQYPIIADIVDNQLTWGDNYKRPEIIGQYAWLMKNSRQVVFNAQFNLEYFQAAAFLDSLTHDRISVVPNWYSAPGGEDVHRTQQPTLTDDAINIIYSGNLNDRVDWTLFESVLNLSDRVRLHVVGDGSRVSDQLRALMEYPNMVYCGPLDEKCVSALLRRMHFAIMPHKKDEISTFMNPLKVLMYRAHGVNTIAMSVPGLADVEGLIKTGDRDEFIDIVRNWIELARNGNLPIPERAPPISEMAERYVKLIEEAMPSSPLR